MKSLKFITFLTMTVMAFVGHAHLQAETTAVKVTVLAKDAKFIGSSMQGAEVTITEVGSGDLLAKGMTSGGTGNTGKIIKAPRVRYQALSDDSSAGFSAQLDLDKPVLVKISARGPMNNTDNAQEVSITQWLIPGKDFASGDGILLELPGFTLLPEIQGKPAPGKAVTIETSVKMMCGCPIEPEGLWDADKMQFWADVYQNGKKIESKSLLFKETSIFALQFDAKSAGKYRVEIFAFDPRTKNTGRGLLSFEL